MAHDSCPVERLVHGFTLGRNHGDNFASASAYGMKIWHTNGSATEHFVIGEDFNKDWLFGRKTKSGIKLYEDFFHKECHISDEGFILRGIEFKDEVFGFQGFIFIKML